MVLIMVFGEIGPCGIFLGGKNMLIRFATRVGCGDPWSFNGSKHGVWLMRQDFPGALWPAGIKTMLRTPEALGVSRPATRSPAPLFHVLAVCENQRRVMKG